MFIVTSRFISSGKGMAGFHSDLQGLALQVLEEISILRIRLNSISPKNLAILKTANFLPLKYKMTDYDKMVYPVDSIIRFFSDKN